MDHIPNRCGVMNLSSEKTDTEEKEVKIRWHQYTEYLYRRDAIKHISNLKSSGCDGIPINFIV